jgi:hypothetical protein
VRASYVGDKSSHNLYYNRLINVPPSQSSAPYQARRPFQPWGVINYITTSGDANLQQLQLEVRKQVSHGLAFQMEYAWNRSIDDVPIVGGPQNPFSNRNDRGNSDGLMRHILTVAGNYELPFEPGKRFLSYTGSLGQLFGGWTISSVTVLSTGTPFSVTLTPSQPGWDATRADRIGSGLSSNRTRDHWFNPADFAVPTAYTYGSGGRNILFGPGAVNIDASVSKSVTMGERLKLQLRGDFFNAPNHSNWANPAANISVPSQVGRILTVNGGRQVQLGAKLLF